MWETFKNLGKNRQQLDRQFFIFVFVSDPFLNTGISLTNFNESGNDPCSRQNEKNSCTLSSATHFLVAVEICSNLRITSMHYASKVIKQIISKHYYNNFFEFSLRILTSVFRLFLYNNDIEQYLISVRFTTVSKKYGNVQKGDTFFNLYLSKCLQRFISLSRIIHFELKNVSVQNQN